MNDPLTRARYRWWPDHLIGEVLAKPWMETAIPVGVLVAVAFTLSGPIPGFLSEAQLASTARQAGELGFLVLGLALVMIGGGVDLSIGSIFALTNFVALLCLHELQ
ncbi:MAG: ABC transporter permease, partial [Burkholderiales bacterium]|nr:ABC transporter permease [Burkholderiales bacterium]